MNWYEDLFDPKEKPLDRLSRPYSYTSIFRTIAFIGDSLASGEFESRDEEGKNGYHDLYEYSWGKYIARKNGLTAYNFSRGGMSTREYLNSFARNQGFWGTDKACQAYVIALGVNDFSIAPGNGEKGSHIPVGTLADIPADGSENEDVFLGRYAAIVSRYKKISPDAHFFFVVPPRCGEAAVDARAKALRDGLEALAGYFENAWLIDLYTYAPVYDEAFRQRYYLYGHMNPMGYILTADMVDSYMDYIIRHNMDTFKAAGFIGSGISWHP